MITTYTPEQIAEVLADHDAAYRKTHFSSDEQVFRELCNVRQRAQTMREIIEQLRVEVDIEGKLHAKAYGQIGALCVEIAELRAESAERIGKLNAAVAEAEELRDERDTLRVRVSVLEREIEQISLDHACEHCVDDVCAECLKLGKRRVHA